MFQLNSAGKITNYVFAIYVDNTHGSYSTIQLGAWEKVGLKNGTDLQMLKTSPPQAGQAATLGWYLSASDLKIGGGSHPSATRVALLEPGEPYIYANVADYAQITSALETLYPDIICSSSANYCKFPKTCAEMKPELTGKNNRKWELILSDDAGNSFVADLHSEALFVNGSDLGLPPTECVIPVFKSQYIPTNEILLGTIFLQHYYVVYDMTPYVQARSPYL